MAEEQQTQLNPRDIKAIILLAALVTSSSLAYAIMYSESYIVVLGALNVIGCSALLWSHSQHLKRPEKLSRNPIEEAVLALVIYLDVGWWFFSFFPSLDILSASIAILLTGLAIAVIFWRGFGYSLESLGIRGGEPWRTSSLPIFLLVVIMISFGIRLLPVIDQFPTLASPERLVGLMGLVVYGGVIIGFVEELVNRAIVQQRLSERFRSKPIGLLLASSLFAVCHLFTNAQYVGNIFDPVGSVLAAFITRFGLGILLGMVWLLSENLTQPWALHATINATYAVLWFLGAV